MLLLAPIGTRAFASRRAFVISSRKLDTRHVRVSEGARIKGEYLRLDDGYYASGVSSTLSLSLSVTITLRERASFAAVNPDLAPRRSENRLSKREGVCTLRYRISIPMFDCLYARHPQLAD